MLVSNFHYHLPADLIAQEPLADRAGSRLLHLGRASGAIKDCSFRDFSELLRPDDLVVFNNTRVFPARLFGRKGTAKVNSSASEPPDSGIEILLTHQTPNEQNEWECLVRPGRKIRVGEWLVFGDNEELQAEVIARGLYGERLLRFKACEDFFATVERIGHIPLPPYIDRVDNPSDKERYQTVFARERGSAAAPTAGLHFTPDILARIKDRGVETTQITLHVGLGTFQPVRVERVEDHKLHRETYDISPEASAKINSAKDAKRRVVAIGTTTVRTLEYAASLVPDGRARPGTGEADIFIYPGYEFRMVDSLLTNFHLPESTLLMLVCAFAGRERVLDAYSHAIAQRYRFYSYGDCMFLE